MDIFSKMISKSLHTYLYMDIKQVLYFMMIKMPSSKKPVHKDFKLVFCRKITFRILEVFIVVCVYLCVVISMAWTLHYGKFSGK